MKYIWMCCSWWLAPICWLDNLGHELGLDWQWLCDFHDRLITGGDDS